MDVKDLVHLEQINIKDIPDINEKWIEDYIASDPKVLGLGDLELRTKQKIQPNAGRLDILLQDPENNLRYEVEIQLGKTDASHIIRTIEYWDIERKRYPQYNHYAVIIAEDITARFFNIVQLFNGFIPLIAIQMKAYKVNGKIAIIFTKILDRIVRDIEPEPDEPADRKYWEDKSSKEIMALTDDILKIIKEIDTNISVKYNKHFIGLTRNGTAFNFATMKAMRKFIRFDLRLERSDEINNLIDDNGFDVSDLIIEPTRYKMRLTDADISGKREILKQLLEKSYKYFDKG